MMRKKMITNRLAQYLGLATLFLVGQACTDLEPPLQDSVSVESSEGTFGGVTSTTNSLEALYNNIENLNGQNNEYALMEVTADNVAVLTRGADWGDNGVWRQLHNHTWNATQLYVLNSWNNRNSQILAATQLLDPASGADDIITAQAEVIRAINMFMVLNFFGQVPFRGVNEGVDVDPTVLSAQEAFDAVILDLNNAISSGNLHTDGPDGDLFTIGEAAARFIRAKVNLNSASILGAAPAGAMDAVIADVNAIEALGFSLDPGTGPNAYFDIWDLSVGNDEVIMALDVGTGQRVFNMIHPNQTGWNGFVTLTETFRLHGTSDVNEDARLGLAGPDFNGLSTGYLRGQQLNGSGDMLFDRQGAPLVYEDELLTSLEINNERNGIRIVKYPQRGGDGFPDPSNDFIFTRFAEALLMRAEAELRGGSGSTSSALADVNAIRTRAGVATLGSLSLEQMKDEITKEMNSEANIAGNRAVQIRFGTFADTWEMKDIQDEFRKLFPIPATALGSNPNLVQNEGY
ncbi:RagB/SusD family nutrient uptake outer membrane protein [Spongiimicrobium sp. 3-5]|uniref:RagB/SusD family nutrient uptake outer membrane protein n=1 Tax=Spongiimicrobium sp. 3-5 TaxID=3332596 RepID=UPI00397EDF40